MKTLNIINLFVNDELVCAEAVVLTQTFRKKTELLQKSSKEKEMGQKNQRHKPTQQL